MPDGSRPSAITVRPGWKTRGSGYSARITAAMVILLNDVPDPRSADRMSVKR